MSSTDDQDEVDLYSHVLDEGITIEMLDELQSCILFPKIKGIATAFYAHKKYKNLPLDQAVKTYINYLEAGKAKPKPVYVPCAAYDFIREYKGIRIVSWDKDREGRRVCTVEEGSPGKKSVGRNIVMPVKFRVTNREEALGLIENILDTVNSNFPGAVVNGLHFSGNVVFVSRHA